MERYTKKIKKGNENESAAFLKNMEEIQMPGLNDILIKYEAPKGENELKKIMHEKFSSGGSHEYFLQRPIPPVLSLDILVSKFIFSCNMFYKFFILISIRIIWSIQHEM